jgi:hypothetical protein
VIRADQRGDVPGQGIGLAVVRRLSDFGGTCGTVAPRWAARKSPSTSRADSSYWVICYPSVLTNN